MCACVCVRVCVCVTEYDSLPFVFRKVICWSVQVILTVDVVGTFKVSKTIISSSE